MRTTREVRGEGKEASDVGHVGHDGHVGRVGAGRHTRGHPTEAEAEAEARAELAESERLIRAGKALDFGQAAEMVLAPEPTRRGRPRRVLTWDWHAWHVFLSLLPPAGVYAFLQYRESTGERQAWIARREEKARAEAARDAAMGTRSDGMAAAHARGEGRDGDRGAGERTRGGDGSCSAATSTAAGHDDDAGLAAAVADLRRRLSALEASVAVGREDGKAAERESARGDRVVASTGAWRYFENLRRDAETLGCRITASWRGEGHAASTSDGGEGGLRPAAAVSARPPPVDPTPSPIPATEAAADQERHHWRRRWVTRVAGWLVPRRKGDEKGAGQGNRVVEP